MGLMLLIFLLPLNYFWLWPDLFFVISVQWVWLFIYFIYLMVYSTHFTYISIINILLENPPVPHDILLHQTCAGLVWCNGFQLCMEVKYTHGQVLVCACETSSRTMGTRWGECCPACTPTETSPWGSYPWPSEWDQSRDTACKHKHINTI